MYDLETVKATLQTKLEELTDPYDTSPDPQPIFIDVFRGEPDLVSLWEGPLAGIVSINLVEEPFGTNKKAPINAVINSQGNKRQSWKAIITGGIVLFVPGNDDEADSICTQLSDVTSDFFKDENCLGLSGVTMSPLTSGASINWRPLTVSLENEEDPILSLTSAIKFTGVINDNLKH